ncbi:D-ribose pyranase [Anaerolineae bacterium CFX9]|nr:D-ribose pyranase [Anaerolineae bacterium CFX9]
MYKGLILNAELNHAIASMGHGDFILVCDAGFPIPNDAWRIDLALTKDVPTHETVLSLISQVYVAERVAYGEELTQNNPPLWEVVKRCFPDSDHEIIPHDRIMGELKHQAKCIVRTGAFDPWGNILLYSGIDVPHWFDKPGRIAPEHYARKLRR